MFILVCVLLLLFPMKASLGAVKGIRMAWENVIASIIPFLAFMQAMIYTGKVEKWTRGVKRIFNFLRINEKSAVPFCVSLLAGYPSGGKIVCDMYERGKITKREAESFLAYCNNGGVVFALSVIGGKFFESYITGIVIFLSQIAAALMLGRVFYTEPSEKKTGNEIKKVPLFGALGKSIASMGDVIGNILASFIVFHAIIGALELDKTPVLCGLVELTGGIMEAGRCSDAPLAAFFFSFGSLSVMAQVAAFSSQYELKMKKYFFGKILSGLISALLTFVFAGIIDKICA